MPEVRNKYIVRCLVEYSMEIEAEDDYTALQIAKSEPLYSWDFEDYISYDAEEIWEDMGECQTTTKNTEY